MTGAKVMPVPMREVLAGGFIEKPRSRLRCLCKRKRDEYYVRPDLSRTWDSIAPELQEVLRALANGKSEWPLYLHGDVGRGKTRAVLAFCDKVESARYWTVDGLMDLMRIQRAPWNHSWGMGEGPSLAILDELGMHQKTGDFEYDAVKKFADWREDLPAIYVSNHWAEKMGQLYDRRIQSRLTCGTQFELIGDDRRMEAAEAKGE